MNPSASDSIIHLSAIDLAIAAGLILITGAISLILKLKLEKKLIIAAVRVVVQLLLIGYALRFIFNIDSPYPLAVILIIMVTVASRTAVGRSSRRFGGMAWFAFFSLLLTGVITTGTVTIVIIGVDPWYKPQYVIPLLGMALGNTMTAISLCLDRLLDDLAMRRSEVEMELAHGATAWEAAQRPLGNAVKRGMIPMINTMMVAGLVSLPGMMTGQILAGADPLDAVKYQIVVMFMISTATAMGCILVGLLAFRRLFNERHQLRVDLIGS